MSEQQIKPARHIPFSIRYGFKLPKSMELKCLSKDLREDICYVIKETVGGFDSSDLNESEYNEYKDFLINVLWKSTEIPILKLLEENPYTDEMISSIYDIVRSGDFNEVIDLIEYIINHEWMEVYEWIQKNFIEKLKEALEFRGAAYWLFTIEYPYQFFPQTNQQQGEATEKAIETMYENGMGEAINYLREAAEHLNSQKYISSIIESFKAMESVAHHIAPFSPKPLGETLKLLKIEHEFFKHPAFAEASEKLADATSGFYGWANQEARHASKTGASNVALNEAATIFGMCASYSAYLINRHKEIEEQKSSAE